MKARMTPFANGNLQESLAEDLLRILEGKKFWHFYDLYSGVGALSFAAMKNKIAKKYWLNDSFPVFEKLWTMIKGYRGKIIRSYEKLSNTYSELGEDDRRIFYNKILYKFNAYLDKGLPQEQKKAALLLIFLINFCKNTPLFKYPLILEPELSHSIKYIQSQNKIMRDKIENLSWLLNHHYFLATTSALYSGLYPTTSKDIVILKPSEDLKDILTNLALKEVPTILINGSANQDIAQNSHLKHFLRLSFSTQGDFLEHLYFSESLVLNAKLPSHIVPYNALFKENEPITDFTYQRALNQLKREQQMYMGAGFFEAHRRSMDRASHHSHSLPLRARL